MVYFYCHYSGEVLSGAPSSTCQSSGAWSNPTPPRCEYIDEDEMNNSGLNSLTPVDAKTPVFILVQLKITAYSGVPARNAVPRYLFFNIKIINCIFTLI